MATTTASESRTASLVIQIQHTPGPLYVSGDGPFKGRFEITSDYMRREGEWDDVYVSFSGYFGSYGPHIFAAAPEMLSALRNITECAEAGADGANMDLWIEQARAAIAKATGVA